MGVYRSQAVAFARYAGAQVAQATRMVNLHQPDGTGCCRSCGRPSTCDDAAHWLRVLAHYRPWAADDRTDHPSLVRPYVLVASGESAAAGQGAAGRERG